MAYSYEIKVGTGATDTFTFSFPYLETSHLSVTVDGTTEAFTMPTTSSVQITSGNPAVSASIKIKRTTPVTTAVVDFVDGSVLGETDLDNVVTQLLYVAQESFDDSADAMQLDSATSLTWDAETKKIVNVVDPTLDQDAATKKYVDDADTATVAAAGAAAAASAASAAVSETNAGVSAAAAAADLVLTNADVVSTNADVVLTNADVVTVAAYVDSFDDRYLGSKASDPTLDNDGNALLDGALYFNTTANNMRVYDQGTTSWITISNGDVVAANNGTEFTEATFKANLNMEAGVDYEAYDATILKDADIGVTLQGYDADTTKNDVSNTFTVAQRGSVTALTSGTTVTPVWADNNYFSLTLAHNATLANGTTPVAGQSGSIFITQDGTGSRTLSYGTYWKFAAGTAPVLSTAAGTVDRLDYVWKSATECHACVTLAVA